MCGFYKIFYEVYTELGIPLGVESVVYYALSAARAVECFLEVRESRGEIVKVVGYVRT